MGGVERIVLFILLRNFCYEILLWKKNVQHVNKKIVNMENYSVTE